MTLLLLLMHRDGDAAPEEEDVCFTYGGSDSASYGGADGFTYGGADGATYGGCD